MVGILSLLDTLLGMEMSQLVKTLNIQQDMREALVFRRGYLGQQLQLIETYEKGEYETVSALISQMIFINGEQFSAMELEATAWANRISDSIKKA